MHIRILDRLPVVFSKTNRTISTLTKCIANTKWKVLFMTRLGGVCVPCLEPVSLSFFMYACVRVFVCVGGRWIASSFSSHRAVFVPMILWAFSRLTERGFFSQGSLGNEGLAVFTPRLLNTASYPSLSCVPIPHQWLPFLPALITQTPSRPCGFHCLLEIRRRHVIHTHTYFI